MKMANFITQMLAEGSLEWQNASYKSTDSKLQSFFEGQANINTTKKATSDLRVFERYCSNINETRDVENIPFNELNIVLGHFFKDMRKKNSDEYEPDSLTAFQRSINRHL